MTILLASVPSVLVGFLGGLLTFKRSNRWCTNCGHLLRCEQCQRATVELR